MQLHKLRMLGRIGSDIDRCNQTPESFSMQETLFSYHSH